MGSHLNPNHFLFPLTNIHGPSSYHLNQNRKDDNGISHQRNYYAPNQQKHLHNHNLNPAKSSPSHQLKWNGQGRTAASTRSPVISIVSDIPRKWCNFVLRRTPDNSVYRSESFRFIQKTNSLEPLLPARNRGFRNKLKLVSVPFLKII